MDDHRITCILGRDRREQAKGGEQEGAMKALRLTGNAGAHWTAWNNMSATDRANAARLSQRAQDALGPPK